MARRRRKDAPGPKPGAEANPLDRLLNELTMPAAVDPLAGILGAADHDDADDDGRAATATEYTADGRRARIGIDRDPVLRRRIAKRDLRRMLREEAAAEQIDRLPDDDEEILLILSGRWHGMDLLGAVLTLASPATITAAHVSSLAINKMHTRRLEELPGAGLIGRITLVVGEIFREHSPSEWAELVRVFGADPTRRRLAAVRNHTKLMALELTDGRRLAIHGSLNLRRCSCYEQAAIVNHADTFDFFRAFVDEIAAQGAA